MGFLDAMMIGSSLLAVLCLHLIYPLVTAQYQVFMEVILRVLLASACSSILKVAL